MGTDLVWIHDLRGALVVLVYINSSYYILSTAPEQVLETQSVAQSKTGPSFEMSDLVKDAKSERALGGRNYNPNRPQDLMSGDKVLRASDGAEMGVFKGGIAKLKASAAAQFILCKYRDLARLIARRIKIFSDFGEVEFFHRESGKVGMEIRGGGDLTNETHPSKGIWTALVTFGYREEDPDSRIFIETRDSGGQSKATVCLKMTGELDVWADSAVNIKTDGDAVVQAANKVNVKAGQINLN
jgi:hypothetical protein